MGNFSRDSFKLTNVLHRLATGEAVTSPRHYVSVRVQQGVPVVDADVNEARDIDRRHIELVLRDVVGDGVPGLGTGFAAAPLEVDNDFAIQPGVLFAGGWLLVNPDTVAYTHQARFLDANHVFLGTDLTTPTADRIDVVYLDAWEEEVGGLGTSGDERLVDFRIGIETSVRLERRWTVRVAEGVSDFGTLTLSEPGHKYSFLGRFFRSASARIQSYMMEDRRRLGLTLADRVKAPLFLQRGDEVVDPARFSQMLAALRSVLMVWVESGFFPVVIDTFEAWFAYTNALNRVLGLTTTAELSGDTGNLSNADALIVITKLADGQEALLQVVRDHGNGVPADMAVLDAYQSYIDGSATESIAGIRPALDNSDLLGAVKAQEELSTFLGLRTDELPEGSVEVTLDHVTPTSNITPGDPFDAVYKVKSLILTPLTPIRFDLSKVVSDVRWAASLSQTQVMLSPNATADVTLTVTPGDTLTDGDFADINVVAKAHDRPTLTSVQLPQRFTVGDPPPGQAFLYYSGTVALVGGQLPLDRADVEKTTYDVAFTLVNSSAGAQSHTFRIDYELVWAGLPPGGWLPAAATTIPEVAVAGNNMLLTIPIRAPSLAGVTEDVSVTLQVTATLVKIDAVPVVSGKAATVPLPIVVNVV